VKKQLLCVCALLLLSGCATYKLQQGKTEGFVVARDGKVLTEYTVGKDNLLPDKELAWERFKRRKGTVEHYYKKIGEVDNRFKQGFIDPPLMMLHFVTGIFRLPFIALADHKYEHNPEYRKAVQERQLKDDAREEARKRSLMSKLQAYVEQDLLKEKVQRPALKAKKAAKVSAVSQTQAATQALSTIESDLQEQEVSQVREKSIQQAAAKEAVEGFEEAPVPVQTVSAAPPKKAPPVQKPKKPAPAKIKAGREPQKPVAVISARPQKGASPLTVRFSSQGSKGARIVSYAWDFGDGDTSEKPRPSNTYYNMGYDPETYRVTLTIKDANGNTATAEAVIEVLPR